MVADESTTGGPSLSTKTLNGVPISFRHVSTWVKPRSDEVPIGMSRTESNPIKAT
jgi:hypothetical protein